MLPLSPSRSVTYCAGNFSAGARVCPPPPRLATPWQKAHLEFMHRNARPQGMTPASTWIGHATTLMQASGLNVLTDPVFSHRASPLRIAGPARVYPPGLSIGELPHIDVVVISIITITWTAIAFSRYLGSREVRRCF